VIQPFAPPHGDYYEKILKPAIEKTSLLPVRADADIFATGKTIDQVRQGVNAAKVLVADCQPEIPTFFSNWALRTR
jgi:hypothetical protein